MNHPIPGQEARALWHPEGHIARKRAAGRYNLDFIGGGARGHGGSNFGAGDQLIRRNRYLCHAVVNSSSLVMR